MKMNQIVGAVFMLSVLASGAARAEVLKDPVGKIQVEVPDSWKKASSDHGVTVADPKGEVSLTFAVVDAKDVKKALDAAGKMMKKITTKLSLGKGQPTTINGMKAIEVLGKAMLGGKPIKLAVTVIQTPNGKGAIVFGLADAASFDSHKDELMKIFESIKPAN
jgi:hypothetical protein